MKMIKVTEMAYELDKQGNINPKRTPRFMYINIDYIIEFCKPQNTKYTHLTLSRRTQGTSSFSVDIILLIKESPDDILTMIGDIKNTYPRTIK